MLRHVVSRPVTLGRNELPASRDKAELPLAFPGLRWACFAGGDSVDTRLRRAKCGQRCQVAPQAGRARPEGVTGRGSEMGEGGFEPP